MKPLHRNILLAIVGIVVVALGVNVYYRAVTSDEQRSDFIVFYRAAAAVLDGQDIYQAHHERGWFFYYPPTLAVALAPLAKLPLGVAVIVWYLLTMFALAWMTYRLVRLCDEISGRKLGPLVIAAVLVNFGPLGSGIQRGQISVILTALMVEAFWWYRRGRTARSGLWIALAAGLKVYPALLLLPMLMRRNWRGLVGFVVGLAFLWIALPIAVMGPRAGWDTTRRYVTTVLGPMVADTALPDHDPLTKLNHFSPTNQSLYAFLGRWLAGGAVRPEDHFDWSLANWRVDIVRRIAITASFILLGVMASLSFRRFDRRGLPKAVLWSLPMLAANFISAIAWHHYYATLTVTYALAGTALVMGHSRHRRIVLSAGLTLAILTNWLHFALYPARQMGVLFAGSALLWITMASLMGKWTLRRAAPDEDTPPK